MRILFFIGFSLWACSALAQQPGTFTVKKVETRPTIEGSWCLTAYKATSSKEEQFECADAPARIQFDADGRYYFQSDSVQESGQWTERMDRGELVIVAFDRVIIDRTTGEVTEAAQGDLEYVLQGKDRLIIQHWVGERAEFYFYTRY